LAIYLLTIMYDPTIALDPNQPSRQPEHARLADELRARNKYLGGAGLAPVDPRRRLLVRGGSFLESDGPFAETKEVLGGYFIVDCDSSDEAAEIASRIPVNERSWVEVRRAMLYP
jgi:hypothetical protein